MERNNEASQEKHTKFKDFSQLLKAYNEIEREFTRRCQKLKESEAKIELLQKQVDEYALAASQLQTRVADAEKEVQIYKQAKIESEERLNDEETLLNIVMANENVKTEIIGQYLRAFRSNGGAPIGRGTGCTPLTPVRRPKNLVEAKALADIMIKS